MVVSLTRDADIAIVTIDNPPVNAVGLAVRQGLWDAVERTEADETIRAVVLACAGRTFIAGADVTEFDQAPVAPHLPDLLLLIERATKPWVAAVHGTALGGGLETAMACHHRIMDAGAKLGLPEVTLGVIPGAGGTVRLPRLVAAETALQMITTGKPISASEAVQAGLADAVAVQDVLAEAIDLARTAPAPTPLLDRAAQAPTDPVLWDAAAAKILKKAAGQTAPKAAVQALRNAYEMDAQAALAAERETFLTLRSAPQSAALRHIFFAERATARVDRIKGVAPRPLNRIGIIGGGTMGAGIAAACLLSGYSVQMIERDADAAEAGKARVSGTLDGSLKRGLISTEQHDSMTRAFAASDSYSALGDTDLVIEAVFEDMEVKKKVFAQIEAAVGPDAIIATNTSYLDVNEIAASTGTPSRVVGLHFFSPAHIMKLLEIVVPDGVSDQTLATAVAFAKSLRKIPVLAGVCDGFIANRIMSAYRREAEYMIEDGALPWEVDAAMVGFGLPMGIFQMGDLAGLDISWAMRKRQAATRDPAERYVEIGDKLCEMGRFGRKTGRGYYLYEDGSKGTPDPEVEALILAESARKGIDRQPMTAEEIMRRILGAMQAEGRKILAEGIARSADDIDVVMVNAYGFPRWRGGPMYMAGSTDG
ncbi:3-hydroxyacyl-CoA dehydrogenase NAD-binding domain-containing protein [Sagittula stellata]|uniref:Enoyl-CoA hydratase/isomerase/3-hydroxyacyl-CoA dehydrogenase n=1 Tax=Sagittula stellata (strain ATCC 700073 / DSM 11524 / E-37) TaxID=388399 RepID=A3K789_SAGS3|nr:3-hydroxyacyl-CoA dehydrogenase NAD-binding domain-containing protein [Sagittula stellata]EBA06848.1 enoyl-CoA hydratase/isomerase/3-hydroxyacyl-CoA dehydrogenase [Sagittula stellata E-37]